MSKKNFFRSIPFLLAAVTVFLAGCRAVEVRATLPAPATLIPQSSAQAQASSKFDACALMTKADAEEILGKPVDSPTNPM